MSLCKLLVCVCVCVQPLMREVVENKAEISKQEARDLVERCLKVLYYRDARSYNRVSSAHQPPQTLLLCFECFMTV